MQNLAISWMLLLAAQVSAPSRYGDAASPPPTGSQLTLADAPSEPPTPAAAPTQAAPEVSPPVSVESAAVGAAPEAAQTPSGTPLQRSVLAQFAKPSDLIREMMKPHPSARLEGAPMTLADAVRDARDRQDQTVLAKAYWDLAAAVGEYNLALLEQTELSVLSRSLSRPSPAWKVRLEEAQARVALTQGVAQNAQLRLQQRLGRRDLVLPLPADVPHCGRYNAEYEEIFGSNPDRFAKQLSELMPLRYAELRAQAQAVADAQQGRDETSRQLNPASDGTELLQAQDLLSLKRRTFISTARDYNHEIAQYTELAAPAAVAPDRLVAMMIRTSTADAPLPWKASGVEQATAQEPLAPPQAVASTTTSAEAYKPQTQPEANQARREVRRPLQRLLDRDREHSIVSGIRRLRQRIEQ